MEHKHHNTFAAVMLMLGSTITVFGADRPPPQRIPVDQLATLAPRERVVNQYAKVVMLDGSSHMGSKFRITGRLVAVNKGQAWEGLPTDQVASIEIWPDRKNGAHIFRAGRIAAKVVTSPCTALGGRQPVLACLPLKIASGGAWLAAELAAVAPVLLIHDVRALGSEPMVYEVVH